MIILILALVSFVWGDPMRFDNYTVYRIVPKNDQALAILRDLEDNPKGFDFWSGPSLVGRAADIMVPPQLQQQYQDIINFNTFESELFVHNVQELIDKEQPSNHYRAARMAWDQYQTLEQIQDWLRELAATDERVTLLHGGTTYEGREILGVKVVFAPGNENRGVFLEANIHAREWITAATATWILNEFLTSEDDNVRQIATHYDWYIFPMCNPDGYVYTHTTNRMWRKTRVPYYNCVGADPNRNWAYQWGANGGSSTNPCSESYAGPAAFSEPTTRSFSEYIATIGHKLLAYIGFHSYGQYLLIPYGHTDERLDNYDDLYAVGTKAMEKLKERHGTEYKAGNIVDLLYVASGSSMDWAKAVFDIPITFTYELRDNGTNGFILPPDQILPTAEETMDSLLAIFEEFEALGVSRN